MLRLWPRAKPEADASDRFLRHFRPVARAPGSGRALVVDPAHRESSSGL